MITDNLPLSSGMEDKAYSELVQQPRIRVASIASGGASIIVPTGGKDIEGILGFLVFDSTGLLVPASATHGLTAPVVDSTVKNKINFTGTAAAAYKIAVLYV